MHERVPAFVVEPGQQHTLDRPTGRHAMPEQSGRKDAGFVDDKQIARPEQIREIGDPPVPNPVPLSVDHQKASRFAVVGRRLRDQLGRKVEIKVGNKHGYGAAMRPPSRSQDTGHRSLSGPRTRR